MPSNRLRYTEEYIASRDRIAGVCSEAGIDVLRVIRPPYLNGIWLVVAHTLTDESYIKMRDKVMKMGLRPSMIFIREVGSGERTLCITLKAAGDQGNMPWMDSR
ncbi:MAG: hypothetical protein JRN29_01990 [Nitrososphaerota archaeon]|nr:hypothetical protein [Nitrososphaerota archaeon]